MTEAAFYEAVTAHIAHARDKHPRFADTVLNRKYITPEASARSIAQRTKVIIHHESLHDRVSLENILLGEVYEFLEEVAKGDRERMLEEAADVAAVLYRALADQIGGAK